MNFFQRFKGVRALCLLIMTLALCVFCSTDGATWKDVFVFAYGILAGNYVSRQFSDKEGAPK